MRSIESAQRPALTAPLVPVHRLNLSFSAGTALFSYCLYSFTRLISQGCVHVCNKAAAIHAWMCIGELLASAGA